MSRVEVVAADRCACRIEAMTAHDLLEVVEIEEFCRLSLWGWESYHAELLRPEAIMLVARRERCDPSSGKSIEGFIGARVSADEVHVNNIGVRESARRFGLGRRLLGSALDAARRSGSMSAVLEVRAGNLPALALYREFGFEVVGRRRNYYRDPTEDALLMNAALVTPT